MQDVDGSKCKTAYVYLKRSEEDGPKLWIAEMSCKNLLMILWFGVRRVWQPSILKAIEENDQGFLCDLWAQEIAVPSLNLHREWANSNRGCAFIVTLDEEVRREYKVGQ